MLIAGLFIIAKIRKQPCRCPSTDEWIQKLWYIHSGILLSHKKEQIWASSSEKEEPRACYTEWSKSKREKQISYINMYIWNLEKRYWLIYLQGRNGNVHVKNGLVDTVGEGKSGTNGESSVGICTLQYVKSIAGKKLLYNTGSPAWCSGMTLRGRMGEGREAQKGDDICVIMANFPCCMAETNTTL